MTKLALITGGQKGIGMGISKHLVDNGWSVAMVSSSPEGSEQAQQAISELGDNACYYQHNLKNIKAIDTLLNTIMEKQGEISSLINNAGVPAKVRGDMLSLTEENFDFTLDINLKGNFFLSQAVAKRWLSQQSKKGYQSIVFVSSVSAEMASIERAEYCLSKSAIPMMNKLFALRLASENIGVFEVRPGIIETGMTAGVKDKYTQRIESGLVPMQRWGYPNDISSVVMPIINGDMAFASGSTINADGGLSIAKL